MRRSRTSTLGVAAQMGPALSAVPRAANAWIHRGIGTLAVVGAQNVNEPLVPVHDPVLFV